MLRITPLSLILFLFSTTTAGNHCDSTTIFKNLYVECELHKNEFLQINTTTNGLDLLHEAFALYINGQNIPKLCRGSVQNFKNLVVLELINSNISEIEAGAFQDLGQSKVRLDFNKLTVIKCGVFNGLDIVSLSVTENEIRYIESGAFSDMVRLETILLGFNKIKEWNGDWFLNTPRLGMINFSFNEIKELPANGLQNINGKHGEFYTNLDLSYNKLTKVSSEAFSGVSYFGNINLSGNNIREISPRLFTDSKKIYEINLNKNNITCLFGDELFGLKKVFVVKLKLNPIGSRCGQFIRKFAEEQHMIIQL